MKIEVHRQAISTKTKEDMEFDLDMYGHENKVQIDGEQCLTKSQARQLLIHWYLEGQK